MKGRFQELKPARGFILVFGYIRTALILVVILLLVYYLIVQVFIVKGVSMDPNFADNELILVNRLSYYFFAPSRGDSIVFIYPGTKSEKYIKRIIGLPGEEIEVSNQEIRVNGERLKEDYIPADFKTTGDVNLILKNDEYYVLGDNRELSNDSRFWGPLTRSQIIGRAQYIFYPFNKREWLERQSYNI